MKKKLFILLIIFFVFFSINLLGQENTKKEKAKIKVSADTTSIPWGDNDNNITLKGNVSVVYETTKLMSAYVIFNKNTKFAESPGKVKINAKETDFTADKGNADFKKKVCKVFGNVTGIVKKEVSKDIKNKKRKENIQKEITENIHYSCDNCEYNYKTKILNADGNIKISEKDRIITCEKLKYDGNNEIFYLNGNVKGVDKEGQCFYSDGEVIVSVKEGNEYIKAPQVRSTFYVDIDED